MVFSHPTVEKIIKKLEALGSAENVAGMKRFGIVTQKACGVSAPDLKRLAKEIKNEADDTHTIALALWNTGIHEARIVAILIDNPKQVSPEQMDSWAKDFDNWAICDSCCGHLFDKTRFAYDKAIEWSANEAEFIKRAGFAMMAWLAVHDKKADDAKIAQFLPILESNSDDNRNFVKKAVNWSLRQIGKRNRALNKLAVKTAENIQGQNTRSARWIAADALRELRDPKTIMRL